MLRNLMRERNVEPGHIGAATVRRIDRDIIDINFRDYIRVGTPGPGERQLLRNLRRVARMNERVYFISFEGASVLYVSP